MILTINGKHSDVNGNFTVSAEALGLCFLGHPHVIDAVSNLQQNLNTKANTNHPHVCIAGIRVGGADVHGNVEFAAGTNCVVTAAGSTITIGDTATAANGLAKYLVNTADNAPGSYGVVANADALIVARDNAAGRSFGLGASADERNLYAIRRHGSRNIKRMFRYANGVETPIDAVRMAQGTAADAKVWPPQSLQTVKITSSIDNMLGDIPAGEQYGLPNLMQGITEFSLAVEVFPSQAEWYLEADGFTLPEELQTTFTGAQTLALTVPDNAEVGSFIRTLTVRGVSGTVNGVFRFWRTKYSNATLAPALHWPLDADFTEIKKGTVTNYPHGDTPLFNAADKIKGAGAYGPSVVYDTTPENAPGACAPAVAVNADNGLTLMCFVRATNNYNNNCYIGFYGATTGEHLYVSLAQGYALASIPTSSSNSIKDTQRHLSKWVHMALLMSPVLTQAEVEAAGKTWNATKEYRSFAFYANGVLVGTVVEALKNPMATVTGRPFYIGRHGNTSQSGGLYVDDVKIFEQVLPLSEIQADAAWAGFTFGDGGSGDGGGTAPEALYDAPRVAESIPADLSTVPLTADLKAFIIDENTVALGGCYGDFYQSRLATEFTRTLPNFEVNYRNGLRAEYLSEFYYRFSLSELFLRYQPLISARWSSKDAFRFDGAVFADYLGGWSAPLGEFYATDVLDGTRRIGTPLPVMAHYVYLRLAAPMAAGSTHTITDNAGNSVTFTYNAANPARSIKVNQEGYSTLAGRKYAYFGQWFGTGGAYQKYAANAAPAFQIVKRTGGDVVFEGTMTRRNVADTSTRSATGVTYILNGEEVWEMDFSNFNTEGEYQIYVPGVGYSYPFIIGANAMGRSFWLHGRGMFIQRSGIAKGAPQTKWEIERDHAICWQGNYLNNDSEYPNAVSASGAPCPMDHFGAITYNATDEIVREGYGGWWDAADWDRREHHFGAVAMLLNAYDLFPANFSDAQLDLPESGDGVPDILSEAIWGLDVWRRTQTAAGAIAPRIESKSHPLNKYAPESPLRMYQARPSCEASVRYARYAAQLAVCLRKADTAAARKLADTWLESAVRAFEYGINDANLLSLAMESSSTTYFYNESVDLKKKHILGAAAALFRATGEAQYAAHINADNYAEWLEQYQYNNMLSTFVPVDFFFSEFPEYFPALTATVRKFVLDFADTWLGYQECHAYRNLNWPQNHAYQTFIGWGAAHPEIRGAMLIYAWYMTGDIKYRDAAYVANDWAAGCNCRGRTMTSGMGTNYPVRFLYLLREALRKKHGYDEPPLGITPYVFYTGGLHADAIKNGWMVYNEATRADCNCAPFAMSLLGGDKYTTIPATRGSTAVYLQNNLPQWRGDCSMESYSVGHSEFTIWETIAGKMFLTGCLLNPGWTPPATWKNREPIVNEKNIDGFFPLP